MRILNFGSMNLDYVYTVQEIVRPGETVKAKARKICCGGKGLNQSIALARAGAEVWHAGTVGNDGKALLSALEESGVNTSLIRQVEGPSSHTVIQVDSRGCNSILFYPGEEAGVAEEHLQQALACFAPGDYLLLQNEIEGAGKIITAAKEKGLKVVLNPSPINEELKACPLELVDCFILNEIEGGELTGKSEPDAVLHTLHQGFPHAMLVLTLGSEGSLCMVEGDVYHQPAFPAKAVDTTGAGDTFTGYFLAGITQGLSVPQALKWASKAAALAVERPGASPSIPCVEEVEEEEPYRRKIFMQ